MDILFPVLSSSTGRSVYSITVLYSYVKAREAHDAGDAALATDGHRAHHKAAEARLCGHCTRPRHTAAAYRRRHRSRAFA